MSNAYKYIYKLGTTTFKKDALNQTTKAQLVTIIANSEINQTVKIFPYPFLVCSAAFLKNQLPPSPSALFWKFYSLFRKRVGGGGVVEIYVNL